MWRERLRFEPRDLRAGLGGRHNSLGVLRLVLALMVIGSHAFPLGGWGDDPMWARSHAQENTGSIAVVGFFAISGYLITKSGFASDVVRFMWHRCLRIFPAFWLALIISAVAIGPLAIVLQHGELGGYWTPAQGGPLTYITNNWKLGVGQWGIGDVFAQNPYGLSGHGSVMNGSLWTLEREFACYLIIAALVLFGVLKHARVLVPLLTAFFWALMLAYQFNGPAALSFIPGVHTVQTIQLTLIFLIGATFAVYERRIVLADPLAIGAAAVVVVTLLKGGFALLGMPALAYLIFWLAARLPRRVQWIGQKNDYSYGVYIYGWPMTQLAVLLGVNAWGYWPLVLVSAALASAMAFLSWHGVERWALAIKDRGPGRGVRFWLDRMTPRRGRATTTTREAAAE